MREKKEGRDGGTTRAMKSNEGAEARAWAGGRIKPVRAALAAPDDWPEPAGGARAVLSARSGGARAHGQWHHWLALRATGATARRGLQLKPGRPRSATTGAAPRMKGRGRVWCGCS